MDAPSDRWRRIGLAGTFLAALVVGLYMARPFGSPAIAFDSQVAVVHFQRITAGLRLEAFTSTTPKPLLTVVYGLLYTLAGDWRAIAAATTLAFALGAAMSAGLAWRLAGPAAGIFAGFAVMGVPALVSDVSLSLATPWALVAWAGAGLSLARDRPGYGLAGGWLAVGTLARVETLVIVGVAVAALLVTEGLRWRRTDTARIPPRRAWLVPAGGLLAVIVMGVHDLLLTGDPLFWAGVSTAYSSATRLAVLTPIQVVSWLAATYAARGALVLLAIVGLVRLALDDRRAIALGIVAMSAGVAGFLVILAARGIYVSDRYAAAIDVALAVGAAIGFASLAVDASSRARDRWPTLRRLATRWLPGTAGAMLAATLVAILLAWPGGVFDAELRAQARRAQTAAGAERRALPALRAALAANPARSGVVLTAPTSIGPQVAVDLRLRPGTFAGADGVQFAASIHSGLLILHIPAAEQDTATTAGLERTPPTINGSPPLELVAADPGAGWWLIRVP